MSDRYYIDERAGCMAVRDRTLDCDSPSLHDDTPGVLRYWHGAPVPQRCPMCHHTSHGGWLIADEDKADAQILCDDLNYADTRTATNPEDEEDGDET